MLPMTEAVNAGVHGSGHVLHVTDCYDGGVSRAINDMVSNAPHLVHSLAFHGGEAPPAGAFAREFQVVGSPLSRMRQFRFVVRRAGASILHVHSSVAGGFVRLGRRPGVPVIYQPHCYKFVDPTLSRPVAEGFRLLERALLPHTALTVVLSPAERAAARRVGTNRVVSIPNVPSLPPGRVSEEGMARHRVVMMGRLAPQKDPDFFLEVIRTGRRRVPDLEAVWIGDGQEDMRSRLLAEGVDVTGWLDQDGVVKILSEGGVYVHTARYEGLPLAVLDAAQSGVAVLLRRIDAFTGIDELVQRETAAELAAEVTHLVQDRSAYLTAVDGGRRLLHKHTHERQAAALSGLYDPVLHG